MAKIVGTVESDTLRGTDEADRIWGLAGSDDIDGGTGDDLVDAGAGDDLVRSASGYDRLDGGDGNDRLTLVGTGGALTGGAGYDGFVVEASSATEDVIFNGASGHGMIGRDPATAQHIFFRDVEWADITTGGGNDTVIAGDFDRLVAYTGAGDDRIEGGAGADTVVSGHGNDALLGGAGDDYLNGWTGDDDIGGGAGDDRLDGGSGNDVMDGGAGDDHIDGGAGDDDLYGGTGDDHIGGGGGFGNDDLYGGAGNDVMGGGAGDDHIDGGAGDDRLSGGVGNDVIDGGAGNDVLRLYRPEPLDFDATRGSLSTGLTWTNIETFEVDGSHYNDVMRGADGDDTLNGGGGSDLLEGRAGDDRLDGGDGADRLIGGDGADSFEASVGIRIGFFNVIDRIVDFDAAEGDIVHFSRLVGDDGEVTGIRDYEHFLAASRETEDGVYVTLDVSFSGEQGLLIEGVSLAEIPAENLSFTGPDSDF